jgi:hypothetical protein
MPAPRSAKIVEGRLDKIKNQMALTNQATLSDPNKTVAELVKEAIAAVGENIKVRAAAVRGTSLRAWGLCRLACSGRAGAQRRSRA